MSTVTPVNSMLPQVTLYDIESSAVSAALANIRSELLELEAAGTLRGRLPAAEQADLIRGTDRYT